MYHVSLAADRTFIYISRLTDTDMRITLVKGGMFFTLIDMLHVSELRTVLTALYHRIGNKNIVADGIAANIIERLLVFSDILEISRCVIICISLQSVNIKSNYSFHIFTLPTLTYEEVMSAAFKGALLDSDGMIGEVLTDFNNLELNEETDSGSSANNEKQSTPMDKILNDVIQGAVRCTSTTLEERFFYFGGCVRFYCQDFKTSVTKINDCIMSIFDKSSAVSPSESSTIAKNTIVATVVDKNYEDIYRFVLFEYIYFEEIIRNLYAA